MSQRILAYLTFYILIAVSVHKCRFTYCTVGFHKCRFTLVGFHKCKFTDCTVGFHAWTNPTEWIHHAFWKYWNYKPDSCWVELVFKHAVFTLFRFGNCSIWTPVQRWRSFDVAYLRALYAINSISQGSSRSTSCHLSVLPLMVVCTYMLNKPL